MTDENLKQVINNKDLYWHHHLNAVRAVAELHSPEGDDIQQCSHDKKIYPCPTIQAIVKELT
jgi:hypothetical protein